MNVAEQFAEQSQETTQPPARVSSADEQALEQLAAPLLERLHATENGDQVAEIITAALKLLRDETNRGDMKLLARSLKEMRYALKVFAPFHAVRKVSIFGSARTPEEHPDYQQALRFSREMVRAGWMVLTGAADGIMAAGHGGAGRDPSFGLAIRLPFEQSANAYISGDPKLITFRYFFTRKVMFLRGSHAVAVFPGGFGTLDEAFEVLTLVQTGRAVPIPIVFVDSPGADYWVRWEDYIRSQLLDRGMISPEDRCLYRVTDSVDEAIAEVLQFYRNYHSIRYARDEVILRLERAPTPEQLAELRERFGDLTASGDFRLSGPLEVERDEPSLAGLARLVFAFNRRNHARLRLLIDQINTW